MSLPTGTVTFLFTDLEGSTRSWQAHPDAMRAALARHDEILRETVEASGGHVVKNTGDGVHAVFERAGDAVRAACDIQRALGDAEWGDAGPLRARIGIHTGEAEAREGDYFGLALNRAARIMDAGHGGQVLVSHTTRQLVDETPVGAIDFVDLGEHRLRDLDGAERLFQAVGPGMISEFPSLRAIAVTPGNLPLEIAPVIGRDPESQVVVDALGEHRIVTITGPGGIGKTTLSVHVGRTQLDRFPDGAWFCDLATTDSADALAEVVAATLGVHPVPGADVGASVDAFLAPKRALLVLDNCEQIIDVTACFAARALEGNPEIRILSTSREPLGVPGEWVVPLGPLGLPDSAADTAAISAADAVRVFTTRAAAARSGFTVTEENARAVAELCRRLDGIPLALELAAARVASMTPAEILDRLDQRFALLTGGPRTAAARHQTLRAAVEWSYSLLDDAHREVFQRLAVFAGTFTLGAAEAVVSNETVPPIAVVDVVGDLVTKSILTIAPDGADRTRYVLLETLRDFALERLDRPDPWRRRHAEYYSAFAAEAGTGLAGPDETAWRRRVRAELPNLRSAVSWALNGTPADQHLAFAIVNALARESYRDRSSGIGEWAIRALGHADPAGDRVRSTLLAVAAHDALGRDDVARALELASEAVVLATADGEPADLSAYSALAIAEAYSGHPDRALRVLADGITMLGSTDATAYDRASLLTHVAIFRAWIGDTERARAAAEEALAIARPVGNPSLLTDVLYAESWAWWSGDADRALAALEECILVTRDVGGHSILSGALGQAARLRARRGDAAGALTMLREAIEHGFRTGYPRGTMYALACTREVFGLVGRLEAAAVLAGADVAGVPLWDTVEPDGGLEALIGSPAYAAAVARGHRMPFAEVVDFTLAEITSALDESSQSV